MASTQHSRFSLDFWWRLIKARLLRAILYLPTRLAIRKALSQVPPNVSVQAISIPSRDSGRTIKAYVFSKSGRAPRPVHLNFHGSGFTVGTVGTDTRFCACLAQHTDAIIIDVDYRKSPEAAYPLPFQDAEDALAYVLARSEQFDTSAITLSGFSAGFALAQRLAIMLGKRARGLISFYGNPDYTNAYDPPSNQFDSGVQLGLGMRKFFYSNIFTPSVNRADPAISLKNNPTDAFPPRYLSIVGDADYLYTPAKLLVERLQAENHPDATFHAVDREAHGFDLQIRTPASEKRTVAAYDACVALVNRANQSL